MIRTLFRNGATFFFKKQNSILSAAVVIMCTVFLSRILGLARDRLLATFFTVDELGVYFAAFRIPNLLFELLVMGALSTAFIPVFTQYLVKEKQTEAYKMASSIINIVTLVLLLFLVPLFLLTTPIMKLMVPGFSENELATTVFFTRIMLLGQLLPLVIGNFVTGMLQSFHRFLLPALAPVVYNVGIIIGIIFLSKTFGLQAAVWGVVLGAVFYFLIQIPLIIKLGYKHHWVFQLHHPGVKEVIKLMVPRTFGLAVAQIDTTVDLILASYLGSRAITIFQFAQHLQQLPIGLFGTTFSQAALPPLSQVAAKKDMESFKTFLLTSMNQILFFVLPASVMLIVLRTPIVRLVFGAARFDWAATVTTGQTVSFFALSIFAQSLVQLFARGFYALYDTKTPVTIGIIAVTINTVLSILFVSVLKLPIWSLALSTSVANWVNVLLLAGFLYRRIGGITVSSLISPLKMGVSAGITAVFLYIPIKLLDQLIFDTTRVLDLLLLTLVASLSGLSVYIFLAWFLDIPEVHTFFKLLERIKTAPRMLFSRSEELVQDDQTSILKMGGN